MSEPASTPTSSPTPTVTVTKSTAIWVVVGAVILAIVAALLATCEPDGSVYIDTSTSTYYSCVGGVWALFGEEPATE